MYSIILAGSDIGAPESGTGAGPDHVMAQLKLDQLESVGKVIRIPVNQEGLKRGTNPDTLNFLTDLNKQIKRAVESVLEEGNTPLVFHGDDSLIIGTGMGLLDSGTNPGLFYFDAHGDINTPETSPSGCLFGMGVAHVMGLGFDQVLALNQSGNWLQSDHIRFVGTRNLDSGEEELIKDKSIRVIDVAELRRDGEGAKSKLDLMGTNEVYIHIDQDVVDPSLSGASLCREPGGLYPEELYAMLQYAKENFDIRAISFGNYKPALDGDSKTLNVIRQCLKIFNVL